MGQMITGGLVGPLHVDGNTKISGTAEVSSTLTVDGASTLTGAVTATGGVVGAITGNVTGDLTGDINATAVATVEYGAGALGTGGLISTSRRTENGVIITETKIDITGMSAAGNTAADAIGVAGTDPSYIGKNSVALNGIIYKIEMVCLEAAIGGDTDIDLGVNSVGTVYIDGAVDTVLLNTATPAAGESYENLLPALTADHYFYLVENGGTAAAYTAGQFIIRTYGHAALA